MRAIREQIETGRDALQTVFYPTGCRVCGRVVVRWRDGVVCDECWGEFGTVAGRQTCCHKCGQTIPGAAMWDEAAERHCGRCEALAFSYARACGPYLGALREHVIRLKRYPQLPGRISQMIGETFEILEGLRHSDLILPVPLHPSRQRERGFNQAEVIARAVSDLSGLRVDCSSLIRTIGTTRHRLGMGVRERERSLAGSFQIRAPRPIAGRSILVVDDVMTTGATAHEISKTLIDSGACAVNVLTLARARLGNQ